MGLEPYNDPWRGVPSLYSFKKATLCAFLYSYSEFHSVMLISPETNNLKLYLVCGVLGPNSPINRELLRTALRLFDDV